MRNQTEDPNINKQETVPNQEWDFESIQQVLKHQTKSEIPDDPEELFRNFDKYVPNDFSLKSFRASGLFLVNKKIMKSALERSLYGGAAMDEVNKFFEAELEKSYEKLTKEQKSKDAGYQDNIDREIQEEYDRNMESYNELNGGSLEVPLADLELRIYQDLEIDSPENATLRKFVERLSAERYKDRRGNDVSLNDVEDVLRGFENFHVANEQDAQDTEYNKEHFGEIFAGFNNGDFNAALKELEFNIGSIQTLLAERKNKEFKNAAEVVLKERYGENFVLAVNGELQKLRNCRRFLSLKMGEKEKQTTPKNKKESFKEEAGEKKEVLEGEELFQYQIENNVHPLAKNLKRDLILFIKSFDKGITGTEDFNYIKEELSTILYQNNAEYEENGETEISEEDKELLQPLLDFRSELDQWSTLSQERQADFRSRVAGYLKNVFGIETYRPNDGENLDGKKARAVKTAETPNFLLDMKIKAVLSPGYEINDKLFDYYQKWFQEKTNEIKGKRTASEDTLSREEFDEQYEEGRKWIAKYGTIIRLIKPAEVEVYKHKA